MSASIAGFGVGCFTCALISLYISFLLVFLVDVIIIWELSNDRVEEEYDQYGDGTKKLLSGDTPENKMTLGRENVSTEPTYYHPQHTGPKGTARRHGWNGE